MAPQIFPLIIQQSFRSKLVGDQDINQPSAQRSANRFKLPQPSGNSNRALNVPQLRQTHRDHMIRQQVFIELSPVSIKKPQQNIPNRPIPG